VETVSIGKCLHSVGAQKGACLARGGDLCDLELVPAARVEPRGLCTLGDGLRAAESAGSSIGRPSLPTTLSWSRSSLPNFLLPN